MDGDNASVNVPESCLRMAQRQFGGGDDCDNASRCYTPQMMATKSVENILEPQLYDASSHSMGKKSKKANISDKIRTMSSRTQKLFSRIYNGAQPSKQSPAPKVASADARIPAGGGRHAFKAATCRLSSPKSRRSLSFGHIPTLDDFKQALRDIDQLEDGDRSTKVPSGNESVCSSGTIKRQPDERKNISDGEDTDSGILVNESGQSSIIETDESVYGASKPRDISDDERTLVEAQDINADIDFKFVRIPIDYGCGLGIGLKAVIGDSNINKRVGYHVASVEKDGMVDR